MKLHSNSYYIFDLFVGIFLMSTWSSGNSQNVTKNYSSYRPNPFCTPSDYFRYPTSIEDVVSIVKEAICRKVKVKVFGARHSQTDIICTDGIPVDNQGLRFFQMNSDNVTATFGAGVNLRECTEFLREHGRALRTTPAYGNITLGGAIGTGAHGSTIKYNSSISSQVVELTIVDGKGKIQVISKSEDLKAFRLNLGLLGIVVYIKLYTVPLYKTLAHNYVVSDEVLTNGVAINWLQNTDQIALYWFPAFNQVVVANWTMVSVDTPGNAFTNDHVQSTYANFNALSTIVKELAFSLTASTCAFANSLGYKIMHIMEYFQQAALLVQTPNWVPIYTEDGQVCENPAVGYYDLMFAPICYNDPQPPFGLACPWSHVGFNITILDNEFGLDLADLSAFIKDVKDIVKKTPTAFPLQGILMRVSDKSNIYTSTAYGRQTVHFEFYLWNRNDRYNDPSGSLAGYQTILQTLRRKFKGRSHWGKSGLVYHNFESLNLKLDPVARLKFISAMDKFDPHEVFINDFGRRIKGKSTKVNFDPLTTHCALLDNCFCRKNTDCGPTQICTTLPGYIYRVCKTRNEVPGPTVDKATFPTLDNVASYFLTDLPTLVKAAADKCVAGSVHPKVYTSLESLAAFT